MFINKPTVEINVSGVVITGELKVKNKNFSVYFQLEKKYAHVVSSSVSPFFALSLLPMMKLHHAVVIDGNVSVTMLANMKKYMSILEEWNIGFKTVVIDSINNLKPVYDPKFIGGF